MGVVAITGAGGYIGQRLIAYLEDCNWCSQILGTDVQEPTVNSRKLSFLKKDIRDHSLIDFWKDQGVDTLVHLAFVLNPMHDEKEMYDININGTLNILKICEELKTGHVIVASSGTAYGAWPDNPEPLKEDHPIRVYPPTFSYAYHKGLNEKHFERFMENNPDVVFNIVRPAVVYGPNTDNFLSRFWKKLPVLPLANGQNPNLQFVHEDDVAQLFTLLIENRVPGPFNVAGDGVVRLAEVGALIGKRSVKLPYRLLYALFWMLWHLHILVEAPPGMLDYMSYPWVLDTTRAKELLGWKPRYSSLETAKIMFETHDYKVEK